MPACCVEGTLPTCRAGLPCHVADDGFGRDAARIPAPAVVVVVVVVFAAPGPRQAASGVRQRERRGREGGFLGCPVQRHSTGLGYIGYDAIAGVLSVDAGREGRGGGWFVFVLCCE